MTSATARWCRSRSHGAVCTRPSGHPGLHNRVGSGRMWSDRESDPAACPGAGIPAEPASLLANGFPAGRALCPECGDFVSRDDGRLVPHDAFRGATSDAEASNRATWFNAHGWDD